MTASTNHPDVAVLGAGPAGSAVATILARRGFSVSLVDRDRFPRAKVCGCCLAFRGVEVLRSLGLADLAREGRPLEEVDLGAGGHRITLPFRGSIVLSREVLDTTMIRHAERSGVRIHCRSRARVGTDGNVRVRDLDGDSEDLLQPRFVVVADGLDGRSLDDIPSFAWRIARHARFGAGTTIPAPELSPDAPTPGRLEMLAGPAGYLGLVRLPDGGLDLAAAFESRSIRRQGGPGKAAAALLAVHDRPDLARIAKASRWRGTPALTRRRVVASERIACVGDAAGYVEPFTGEGMSWALQTAADLAELLETALKNGGDLLAWRRRHARLVGSDRRRCHLVARLVRIPGLAHATVRTAAAIPFIRSRLAGLASGGSSRDMLIGGVR